MLEVFKFIFKCVADLISMLFSVDIGFMSLGMLMCIVFIFLPMLLSFINLLKYLGDDIDLMDTFKGKKGGKDK